LIVDPPLLFLLNIKRQRGTPTIPMQISTSAAGMNVAKIAISTSQIQQTVKRVNPRHIELRLPFSWPVPELIFLSSGDVEGEVTDSMLAVSKLQCIV
jgi:hypothetical protein